MYRKKRVIFDIDVAFLNGDLEEEIFMDCPKQSRIALTLNANLLLLLLLLLNY